MTKQSDIKKWEELAAKELRGDPVESLNWKTPEGIAVKPLYTAADLEGLRHLNSLPGLEPYVRGPRATMYASPMRFIADVWPQDKKACRWLLIWPPTGGTTPTIRVCPVISERPVWQWIPLKI